MNNPIPELLKGWIPYKLLPEDSGLLFHWRYTGTLPYTEPFFDETLIKCMKYEENTKRHKSTSSAAMLPVWAQQAEAAMLSAFIFHVSRCGSTLVSQALGIKPEHISLAEVPVFDSILRLQYNYEGYDEQECGELLKSVVKFYGAARTGLEKKLFIKTDSWHLLFHRQLRKLYPNTPFIILYRNPEAVLYSNRVKTGIQGIYGMIEPELLGLENIADEHKLPDTYMPLVLERYYRAIIEICHTDRQTLLLNYELGLPQIMQQVGGFTGIEMNEEYKDAILQRSGYNAKYPDEKFAERVQDTALSNDVLHKLQGLYQQIELLRLKNHVPA